MFKKLNWLSIVGIGIAIIGELINEKKVENDINEAVDERFALLMDKQQQESSEEES